MERRKNEILPELQERFENALNQGVLLELTPGDWSALEVDES